MTDRKKPHFFPLQLVLATFAGCLNREQAQVVAYLVEEHRVLREQLGHRPLRLTDNQRAGYLRSAESSAIAAPDWGGARFTNHSAKRPRSHEQKAGGATPSRASISNRRPMSAKSMKVSRPACSAPANSAPAFQ